MPSGVPRRRDPDGALTRALRDHIERHGPIGFDEYVAHALYTPDLGFYRATRGAGRRRDFLTSPEVGPLFGAVVARALDRWWDELGRPDPFWVVEAGAGPGTLARTVLASAPACSAALRLVLVEVGEGQRASHPRHPQVVSRSDLPDRAELGDGPVVVIANELLDNLPFGLVEKTPTGWVEVAVDVVSEPGEAPFIWASRPLDAARVRWCDDRAGPGAPVGGRMPVQVDASEWLARALALVGRPPAGRVVLFDYTSTSRDMARRPWREWVRTYAGHGRSGDPLDDPGSCDVTVEVAVDQLALVRPADRVRSQAEFLVDHGIDLLVAEGRRRWEELGMGGGLAAIEGRSRVGEAAALTDPAGLGGFTVLEWESPNATASHPP